MSKFMWEYNPDNKWRLYTGLQLRAIIDGPSIHTVHATTTHYDVPLDELKATAEARVTLESP